MSSTDCDDEFPDTDVSSLSASLFSLSLFLYLSFSYPLLPEAGIIKKSPTSSTPLSSPNSNGIREYTTLGRRSRGSIYFHRRQPRAFSRSLSLFLPREENSSLSSNKTAARERVRARRIADGVRSQERVFYYYPSTLPVQRRRGYTPCLTSIYVAISGRSTRSTLTTRAAKSPSIHSRSLSASAYRAPVSSASIIIKAPWDIARLV